MDCLFRVKTITLETANVTNCHVIATDILFLSSNHRSVQFLYLAASMVIMSAMLNACKLNPVFDREIKARSQCVQKRNGGTRSQLGKSGLRVTGVRKGREREFFLRSHSPSLLFRTPATQARRSPKDYLDYHIFEFAFN